MSESCFTYSPLNPTQGRVSSRFGVRPGRTTGEPTFHAGLDFRAERGTPVLAVQAGTVRVVRDNVRPGGEFNGYGNCVAIEHVGGWWSFYAHMDERMVDVGDQVSSGMQIGTVGNTTNGRFPGMGVHLHFEVRRRADGRAPFPGPYRTYNVDPATWLSERGVELDRRGNITVTTRACLMPPAMPAAKSPRPAVPEPAASGPVDPMNALYEPPTEDADLALWAALPPWTAYALGAGAALLLGIVAANAIEKK